MKISFSPLGLDGTIVSGSLPIASGALYAKVDGSRPMTGALLPYASGKLSLGSDGLPFSSGCFGDRVVCSGFSLKNIAGEWSIRNNLDNGYVACVAEELRTTTSGVIASGAFVRLISSGIVAWDSGGTPNSDGTHNVNMSRQSAGIVRIGTSGLNALGGIDANSGVFTSGGITLVGAHGSGVVLGISNNGLLTVTGPFIYV